MTLYPGFAELYHEALPAHVRRYLNARGISDPVIEQGQLGWNGERITIPVYNRDGQLVLYKVGKAPDDPTDSPKMLYDPPGVSAELYGWDMLVKHPSFLIVCEGEYDRLVLETQGFPAVTGTGGAGVFKAEWAAAIRKVSIVFVCFDNDAAGRHGAERVGRLIPQARIINLPPEVDEGGDVTDFFVRLRRTRADFIGLLKAARPAPVNRTPLPARRSTTPSAGISDIGRLKLGVRIEEIVGQYLQLRRSGRTLMGRCCFHEDHVPSLAVFPETQSFYCFGCQKHGDVVTFLMEIEHLSFREAVKALRTFAHL